MTKTRGFISVIHGPMFSGKTEELLRRIRRARVARKNCVLFKPTRDSRYLPDRVLPHSLAGKENRADLGELAQSVETAGEILEYLDDSINLVGIEEAQFFDEELLGVVQALSRRGIDVVLSLLDQDFRREPFPLGDSGRTVGDYLAVAHESLKLRAICVQCGREAQHSQKLVYKGETPAGEARYAPASYHEVVVAVGAGRDDSNKDHPPHIYEARCLECHEIPDEPGRDRRTRPKKAAASPEEEGEEVLLIDANDEERARESARERETAREQAAAANEARPLKAQKGGGRKSRAKKQRGDNLPDLLEMAD